MRKTFGTAFLVVLTTLALTTTGWAATHNFNLSGKSTVAGIQLEPGKYKLELDGNTVKIFQNGKLVAQTRVEVKNT